MAGFEEIDKARRLLGLGETATLKEIKNAYKRKAFSYHPDKHSDDARAECEEMTRTYPYEEYLRKYYHGWFDGI